MVITGHAAHMFLLHLPDAEPCGPDVRDHVVLPYQTSPDAGWHCSDTCLVPQEDSGNGFLP